MDDGLQQPRDGKHGDHQDVVQRVMAGLEDLERRYGRFVHDCSRAEKRHLLQMAQTLKESLDDHGAVTAAADLGGLDQEMELSAVAERLEDLIARCRRAGSE
jgi:hypothetical protein